MVQPVAEGGWIRRLRLPFTRTQGGSPHSASGMSTKVNFHLAPATLLA
jgi:hypothetical protein